MPKVLSALKRDVTLPAFLTDRRGNIAVLTALLAPVLLLSTFGGVTVSIALAKRQELANIAQLACSRAVKPTRMKLLTDAGRTAHAETYFDELAADRNLEITSRTITSDWLTAKVTATAKVPALENVAIAEPFLQVSASATCEGLPPFPKKGEVILSSNFEDPTGSTLPMSGSWGVYKATQFGWEGGDGPGVEIQDWKKSRLGPVLPEGAASRYVVELDSHANSTMYRTLELHQGTYEFSMWYWGRSDVSVETNRISVYLEGVRPVSPRGAPRITFAESKNYNWVHKTFRITVDTYSLYKLTIAGEGTSDSYGGVFNNLKMTYIGRPGEAV